MAPSHTLVRGQAVAYAVLVMTLVIACSYTFQKPASNGTYTAPVASMITWNASSSGFFVKGDDVDSTSRFTIDNANDKASGSLMLNSGQHTVQARGNIGCWYCYPQTSLNVETRVITAPAPFLTANPAYMTIAAGAPPTLLAITRSDVTNPTTITITPSNANVSLDGAMAGRATTQSLDAAGAGHGGPRFSVSVAGVLGGRSTITVTARGFSPAQATVTVLPVILQITPQTGAAGTSVTVSGHGFGPGSVVRFGGKGATTTVVSANELTATVPNLPLGTTSASVVAGGQRSALEVPFYVVLATTVVFRASDTDVQGYDFLPTPPTKITQQSATPSPGGLASAVDVAINGSTLVRVSSSDTQVFTLGVGGVLGTPRTSAAPNQSTSTSVAIWVWAGGERFLRAYESGIEVYAVASGTVSLVGQTSRDASTSTAGVALAVRANMIVRTGDTFLEVFDLSTRTPTPTLLGRTSTVGNSRTGVDVAFLDPNHVVRAYDSGIELYDITDPASIVRTATNVSGAHSNARVSVAMANNSRYAVRATDLGIEVYDVWTRQTITFLGSKNGDVSATGVSVAAQALGTIVYRVTDDTIEQYDISTPAAIPVPKIATKANGVTQSAAGVAVAKPSQ